MSNVTKFSAGENITGSIEGSKMTLVIDLAQPGRASSTGKTILVASSGGAVPVAYPKRPGIKVAVNITAPIGGIIG